ncbi:hypothetical protein KM043_012934 [Ampulex compressa]|nr:hypothetical protein KM043_012934 [Ampulex compressa]
MKLNTLCAISVLKICEQALHNMQKSCLTDVTNVERSYRFHRRKVEQHYWTENRHTTVIGAELCEKVLFNRAEFRPDFKASFTLMLSFGRIILFWYNCPSGLSKKIFYLSVTCTSC